MDSKAALCWVQKAEAVGQRLQRAITDNVVQWNDRNANMMMEVNADEHSGGECSEG